jgi:hypothetical protein
MINVAVLVWELGRRQRINELLTQNPQYFAWQELLLESLSTTLLVGMVLAFLSACLLWEMWRWWYHQLRSLVPATRFYEEEGPDTTSGQEWLDADSPHAAIPLALEKRPERLAVSNVQGLGQLEVYLSERSGQAVVLRRGERLTLTDDIHRYAYSEVSLVDLPPATYELHLTISGQDARGLIRYIALERGTSLAGLAAGALTLLLTGALVSALILIFEAHDLAAAL